MTTFQRRSRRERVDQWTKAKGKSEDRYSLSSIKRKRGKWVSFSTLRVIIPI
jgi:hypothetical protein